MPHNKTEKKMSTNVCESFNNIYYVLLISTNAPNAKSANCGLCSICTLLQIAINYHIRIASQPCSTRFDDRTITLDTEEPAASKSFSVTFTLRFAPFLNQR